MNLVVYNLLLQKNTKLDDIKEIAKNHMIASDLNAFMLLLHRNLLALYSKNKLMTIYDFQRKYGLRYVFTL